MEYQLITPKRLLTVYSKKLNTVIERFKSDNLEALNTSVVEGEDTTSFIHKSIQRLEEAIGAIEEAASKIRQLLQEYATEIRKLGDPPQKEIEDFQEYTLKAEETLALGFDYVILLRARLQAFKSYRDQPAMTSHVFANTQVPITSGPRPKKVELPTLPVPTFKGNIWEWDNFWELFNSNVHSQDLSALFKFNYLLNALKGEALEAIKKFQVTADNYPKAVEFLKNKYGNQEELVFRLIDKLEQCSLRSHTIRDQRALFEQIQVIVEQLKQKDEHVDSQWILKKVLSKFPDHTQRKVLAKKQTSSETLTMKTLLEYLEEIISGEEMISNYIQQSAPLTRSQYRSESGKSIGQRSPGMSCMYCSRNHKPFNCDKFKTPQERSQYLRQNNLCLICSSPHHSTTQCKKPHCFKCQKPHHTSCCFQLQSKQVEARGKKETDPSRRQSTSVGKTLTKKKANRPTTKINSVGQESSVEEETSIFELQSERHPHYSQGSFLPTGEATIMDPNTRSLRKITVLLDTGAEISFIDAALAEELRLPTETEVKLKLHTFGAQQVQESTCRRVTLDIWDDKGCPLSLKLLTYDVLTKPFFAPPIQDEDVKFVQSLNVPVSLQRSTTFARPLVLLGCDQLWQLVCDNEAPIRLPSGLHLLPTRLGHLITGQAHRSLEPNEVEKWDGYWTLDGQVNTFSALAKEGEEQEKWEAYWNLESAGTEEFSNPEKEVHSREDREVWDKFNQTIEKRDDGYYVRLPWKNVTATLPDNRSIAFCRLVSVWNSLQKDEDLLEQYNGVFQDQLKLRILEEVETAPNTEETRIHYIPHQAVLTPHKTTTKLRVVYDASAHYKGCPSLNDVLHRGPVILPLLFGILLRFRIGRIAIISDVEKAFLQVRLHEADRDATRCLWLRNHKLPPRADNLLVLRFTRVTFGLNSSPFLLAGTTHYHLDQYKKDPQLAKDIKDNLYVDNLIMTADSLDASQNIYRQVKEIFEELNMNIREFVSNDSHLIDSMKEKDKSSELSPKVLGIPWSSSRDLLEISCHPLNTEPITKRTVTSTIASIYDPLGWLVPLMHPAKIFLRSLWQEQLDWDTPLPQLLKEKWLNVCERMTGFKKNIPRFLIEKHSQADLVAFADASSEAISACLYLQAGCESNLLMAKEKLPSLKSNATIPKMELDAVTLSMRLVYSVLKQVQSVLTIQNIFVMSDSEIVLNWIKTRPLKGAGTRVFNRLMEIGKITTHLKLFGHQVHFAHIPSELNPADCATRGLTQNELLDHFWWKGPDFIQFPHSTWSKVCKFMNSGETSGEDPTNLPPEVNDVLVATQSTKSKECADIFRTLAGRSFTSIKRIVAQVLRYIAILVKRVNEIRENPIQVSFILSSPLQAHISGLEIARAGKIIVQVYQKSAISPSLLQRLHHLNVRSDNEGLLRCFGRMGRSDLSETAKTPLLVLQNSWLAEAIISDCHNNGHPGINHTMSIVRQTFWIPKLRAQVTRYIRKCVPCQKLNNLPYKYPLQGDLPEQRVQKSRPFSHVGLDYFGPLAIMHPDGSEGKSYGCIITCMATRLIHLDATPDLSTLSFLQMLRRFFSRRGTPRSITSDNAPTFTLGETVLKECIQAAQKDPEVESLVANREIQWHYITPYAPWQGGFYERLIKSVKHSLLKTLGKTKPTHDVLITVLVEIEALLNTRPLLYEESNSPSEQVLRPIDFLQKDFEVPIPLDRSEEEQEDPSFMAPEELNLIKTKREAILALRSSCKFTENFWNVWRTHYLTSLREKHLQEVGKQRGSSYEPQKDHLVLISDPVQPRHFWKMGRIQELISHGGVIREAIVILPSRRKIRRPVNQLVPLELEQSRRHKEKAEGVQSNDLGEKIKQGTSEETPEEHNHQQVRYNLRPRKQVNYDVNFAHIIGQFPVFSIIFMILGLSGLTSSKVEKPHSIKCVPGGVELITSEKSPYQICAEDFCKTYDQPREMETVNFPSQVVLHDHQIQWKFTHESIGSIETICPAAPFCEHLDCVFCSTVVFNPECWPVGSIIATCFIIYFLVTGCYVFLYIPLTIGRPVRILTSFVWHGICRLSRTGIKLIGRAKSRGNRPRSTDLVELLAVSFLVITTIPYGESCQQVDLFSHTATVCTNTQQGTVCKVQVSEVLKLNAFKKEACFKLLRGNMSIHEFRVEWHTLSLLCEPETTLFTRETTYHVVDSKRCPHTGSCVGQKCADINETSLLPELSIGNNYPGVTRCVESCGGPGCDCFYWSSGCLFYRIYVTPISSKVYEIFRCDRWIEAAKVKFTHTDIPQRKTQIYTAFMKPSIPLVWKSFKMTLALVKTVPTPLLNSQFISDDISTALWNPELTPALRCETKTAAENFDCEMADNCACYPAETQTNCKCKDLNISAWMQDLRHSLPLILSSLTFKRHKEGKIQAVIPSMTTAEIIITFQDSLKTDIKVDNAVCSVSNAVLTGCYSCSKGSSAQVECKSSRPTQAEITCENSSFTVECDPKGKSTTLRFHFSNARIHQQCNVSCGDLVSSFEISGVLKFTHSAYGIANRWLRGKSATETEIQWPDFWHITDVFLQWYKTLLAAILGLLMLLAITYLFISTCGAKILIWIIKTILLVLILPIKLFFRLSCHFFYTRAHKGYKKDL